jgi:hypothetical protein
VRTRSCNRRSRSLASRERSRKVRRGRSVTVTRSRSGRLWPWNRVRKQGRRTAVRGRRRCPIANPTTKTTTYAATSPSIARADHAARARMLSVSRQPISSRPLARRASRRAAIRVGVATLTSLIANRRRRNDRSGRHEVRVGAGQSWPRWASGASERRAAISFRTSAFDSGRSKGTCSALLVIV